MYADCNSLFEFAQSYSDLGFALFPCHSIEKNKAGELVCTCGNASCNGNDVAKHPLTPHGFKDATKDKAKLAFYFSGDYAKANIAVATGELSGVSVLDVDDLPSLEILERKYGKLPDTWTARSGSGGYHFYFDHDERWANCINAQKFCGGLDSRTDGGYVIAPPSLHKNGNEYVWVPDKSPHDLKLATAPDWLLNLIPKRKPKAGGKVEIQAGTSLADRARKYLESVPPAISGQGGHSHTYATFCRVVELFGLLTDNELLSVLGEWNERCSPPWTDNELRHKLTDARRRTKPETATDTAIASRSDADGDGEPETDDSFPELSDDALYGLAGDIVRAIEPETEADKAGVLVSLLVAVGNAIGNRPSFSVGGGVHHTNLFACLVGETSAGKGQAWDIVDYLMRNCEPDWRKSSILYGLSSGEGLVERLSDPVDEDGTPLVVPEQKRLLCLETEFSRPITAMRREGNTLSALLRSAWDGQTLEVATRGKSKLRASNAFVSMLAHITPSELGKLLSGSVETTNGFSNRFLWTMVRSSKDLPSGGNIAVLDRFIEPLGKAISLAKTITRMERSPEAERRWNDAYPYLKNASIRATERGRPQVLRLAMLYALLDSSPIIHRHHLDAALALWRYCDDSARMIFADDAGKLEKRIRELVCQKPGIKRSEIARSLSHKIPASRIEGALAWLVERGEIVHDRQGKADTYRPKPRGEGGKVGNHPLSPSVIAPNSPLPPFETKGTETVIPPIPPFPPPKNVQPATLADLFEWRAVNGVTFCRREDGGIWVTNEGEYLLTPAIEAAIHANQETLSAFVPKTEPPADPKPDPMGTDEFFVILKNLGV